MRIQAFLKSDVGSCMFHCKEHGEFPLQKIISYLNEIYPLMNIIWIKVDGKKVLNNDASQEDPE